MGLFTVDKKHRVAYLARVGQNGHGHERERGCGVPCAVGIDGARMKTSLCLVVVEIILDELRFISLESGRKSRRGSKGACPCVSGALLVQLRAGFITCIGVHSMK